MRELRGRLPVRSILLTSLVVLATACETRYRPAGSVVAHAHPNGLAVRFPAAVADGRLVEPVSVARDADGFTVSLSPGVAVRWQTLASISLRPASEVPQGKRSRERKLGGRTIHFAEERADGGSCGAETTFTGWEPCGERVILYSHVASSGCGGSSRFFWLAVEATDPSCRP